MKKITLIVFMFFMSLCGYSQLALEDFEDNGNAFPTGWQQINVAGPSQEWVIATHNAVQTPAYGGSGHVAYLQRGNVPTGTTEDWLVTPQFNVPANGQLCFMSRLTQLGDNGSTYRIMIHVGNTPMDTSAYTEVQAWTELTLNPDPSQQAYLEKVVTLPASAANEMVYLAFVMNGNGGDRWLVDNVKVVEQCLDPVGQPTTNIGTDTATLNWTNPAGANEWDIDIVGALQPATGVGLSYTGLPPYTATTDSAGNPLQPATQYKYFVRGICDADGTASEWAGPYFFTTVVPGTNCAAPINVTMLPFSQTSNTNLYGDDIEGSPGAAGGCSTAANYLNGDEVVYAYTADFTGNVSFSMTNNGANSGMFVYASCSDIGVSCLAGGTGNATTPVNIASFAVTNGTTYYIVISTSGTTQSTPYTLTIQRVNCAPPVGQPTTGIGPNSANLSWTNPSGATAWEVVIQTAGTGIPPGAGTTANTNTNWPATGLAEATNYEYYVRADCGDGTFSAWAGPYTFSTTQTPVGLNYTQDFEGVHGWALNNGTQTNKWVVGTSTFSSPAKSLYISDDGSNYNYNVDAGSVVQAYRDIQIPAGADQVSLSFDWKSVGENCCDYLRVWVVPATWTPVPGTQTTAAASGGVQIGGNMNAQADWQTVNITLNAAPFASTVRRLVFEWRNDGSIGPNPPAAIDNINIALITCPTPTALTIGTLTENSATFNWTAPASVTPTYDYYLSTTNTAPTGATVPTGNVSANTVTITPLTPSTAYYFWVRSNCGTDDTSFWVGPVAFNTPQIPAAMNFTENFDAPTTSWTLNNGTQTNKWFIGEATFDSPGKSLYVTNDDGVSNAYTNNANSVVQAYRDIEMPAALDQLSLSFRWKALAENCCDYVKVWLVPITYTPTPGTQTTAANSGGIQIGGNHNGQAEWQTASYIINGAGFANSIRRLVFEWRNDGSVGNPPPGAIDNVDFRVITCPAPTALTLTSVSLTDAAVSWTGPTSVTPTYDYYYSTSNTAPTETTVPTGNVSPTNVTISPLMHSTTYYFWVRSNCGSGDTSFWTGPLLIQTPQIPAAMNFAENFDAPASRWTLLNGTQPNKWFIGEATFDSPGKSLYITNDDGVSNAYTNNAGSVVHAYRDITMPAATDQLSLSFRWKALAENCCDYVKVWLVPVTFTPTPGTQMTAANSGGIQIGGNHNGQAGWQTANYVINGAAFANSTRRLVFEWRNDGSVGNPPPGAIDNIDFRVITCHSPTNLALTNLGTDSVTFTWTAPASAPASYDYYLTTSSAAPTATTVPTGNVTATTVTITPLNPSTSYYFWVRSNCGVGDTSFWVGPNNFNTPQIPADLNYSQDFEETNPLWTLSNGTQTNQWIVGTDTSLSPSHSLYISNNNSNNVYTNNRGSVVHAYRDLNIPPASTTTQIEVSFDWKGVAEACCDYLRVWVVPVTFTPTPGTQITEGASGGIQLGANMNQSAEWTHENFVVNTDAFAGGIRRLIFEWRNDGSGGVNPPVAVDNVLVTIVLCPRPNVETDCVTSTSAGFSWEPGDAENWEYALLPGGSPAPASGTATTTPSYSEEGLTPNTAYTFYVRAICGGTDGNSSWASVDILTPETSVAEAEPFCGESSTIIFDNVYDDMNVPEYGAVACLGSTPNPVWYYLQVAEDGELDFQMIQNTAFDQDGNPIGAALDVDFAVWGPFTSLTDACAQIDLVDCPTCPSNTGNPDFYPFGNIVDCSYSASATETMTIPNAMEGQIYAVLITNYNGDQGQIQLQQLDSSVGSTNCDILYNVDLGDDQILCGVADTTITATVTTPGNSQEPTYEWFMDGSTTPFTPVVVSTTDLSQTIQVTAPGYHTYTVVVTVANAANTEPITDDVIVALGPEVNIADPAEVALCGDEGSTSVDLTTLNDDVLGTLSDTEYAVSYYETEEDANGATNAIDTTVPYVTSSQVIYVRVNNIAVDTCFDVVPLTITVNETAEATISYADSPYCTNGGTAAVTHTGDTGGAYSSTDGLTIDVATGDITLASSTAGTYTVTYTIAETATCPEFTTTAEVVIEAAPEAVIAYTGTPYCSGSGTATVSHTGATGGTYSSTAGLTIDAGTGEIDLAASTEGTYTVTYTIPATAACDEVSFTTEMTISTLPVATIDYAGTPYCSNGGTATVTHTGSTGGTYSSTTGLSINTTTGDIDLAASTAGTYTVTYTIAETASCSEVTATATVTITTLPSAMFTYGVAAICQNAGGTEAPTFDTGAVAGTFTSDIAGLDLNAATGVINPATSMEGTYTVTNKIAGANGCDEVMHSVTITINAAPIATFSYDAVAYCQDSANPSPILDGAAGTFSSTEGLVINSTTGVIDLAASQPGTYTVSNTIPETSECPPVTATTTVSVTSIPVVAVLQGCEGGAYMLEVSFDEDDIYTVDNVEFAWTNAAGETVGSTYKIQVTSPETYSLIVTPLSNNECSLSTSVPVESTTCDIPRGISPNNDDKNESFDLTTLDVRKLSIFNRYGQEVYNHGNGYTDQWRGQSNSGEELPTGTYFYMIERANGESKTGWVYINREE